MWPRRLIHKSGVRVYDIIFFKMGNRYKNTSTEKRNQFLQQARLFRQNPTKAEAVLWEELRDRKLGGIKLKDNAFLAHLSLIFSAQPVS